MSEKDPASCGDGDDDDIAPTPDESDTPKPIENPQDIPPEGYQERYEKLADRTRDDYEHLVSTRQQKCEQIQQETRSRLLDLLRAFRLALMENLKRVDRKVIQLGKRLTRIVFSL